ncbi:MAG: zinc metallopeptidase [Firmicutes bacterium]|nr:zinc metallopeptidase [Bacillota bacterium]
MPYYRYDILGYVLVIVGAIITLVAQFMVNSRYNNYKKQLTKKGLSGQEVARLILDKNGLSDVYVTEVSGILSDHYDPNRKVVRLSTDIFHGTSIAACSVAAHEVGHAIQDKENYFFIRLRGMIFPLVNFASKFGYIAIMIGFFFNMLDLAWGGIGLLLIILFFQLITLPVEFNASSRASVHLKELGILDSDELEGSNEMLKAAAMTYVASLATTLLEILRFVLIIIGRNDRD